MGSTVLLEGNRKMNYELQNYKNPVPRKLMSKDEIRWCEKMVAAGLMAKGVSDDKQKSVIYYSISK
ncbi:MAG: hypothetical protein EBX40_02845 [Gammaproteobacteria bacterium]|nr:hypothetical protein [Gammaproteobacteria bacterium]